MKLLSYVILSVLFISCGSSEKKPEPRTFKKQYEVVDAKAGLVPSWINEPQEWASANVKGAKDLRFFVYDTEPKNSRSIACKIAKANANANIASEITQFIKQSLGSSSHGDPTDMDEKLDEYVETTLAQEVQSFVVGASTYRTYWEQRSYKKDLGSDRDFRGYTCAALVKISKKNLERAINRASKKIEGVANPEAKENVKSALKDVAEKFNNLES